MIVVLLLELAVVVGLAWNWFGGRTSPDRILIAPFGLWLQRRIVEAPRGDIDPSVDDALRTAAVRAVHHSVLGVLLCGVVATAGSSA